MKIRKICSTCGSANVVKEAWSIWDEDAQEWVLDNVFDCEYCTDCESDTTIENVPLPAEVTEEDE